MCVFARSYFNLQAWNFWNLCHATLRWRAHLQCTLCGDISKDPDPLSLGVLPSFPLKSKSAGSCPVSAHFQEETLPCHHLKGGVLDQAWDSVTTLTTHNQSRNGLCVWKITRMSGLLICMVNRLCYCESVCLERRVFPNAHDLKDLGRTCSCMSKLHLTVWSVLLKSPENIDICVIFAQFWECMPLYTIPNILQCKSQNVV